jgi:hypothetical protein
MARFIAEFDIDNAAFQETPSEECAKILRRLAATIERQTPVGALQFDGAQIRLAAR